MKVSLCLGALATMLFVTSAQADYYPRTLPIKEQQAHDFRDTRNGTLPTGVKPDTTPAKQPPSQVVKKPKN